MRLSLPPQCACSMPQPAAAGAAGAAARRRRRCSSPCPAGHVSHHQFGQRNQLQPAACALPHPGQQRRSAAATSCGAARPSKRAAGRAPATRLPHIASRHRPQVLPGATGALPVRSSGCMRPAVCRFGQCQQARACPCKAGNITATCAACSNSSLSRLVTCRSRRPRSRPARAGQLQAVLRRHRRPASPPPAAASRWIWTSSGSWWRS